MVAERSLARKAVLNRGGRSLAVAVLSVLGSALIGCGGSARPVEQQPIRGTRLAIYASAPLHGPQAAAGRMVLQAERLALQQDGGEVGRYRVRLVTLDAARPFTGGADPVKVSQNARRAARDLDAVAYLGEVRTGASAVSIPILNEAGILQISPLDTALGLTTHTVAITGSPVRYYPNAARAGRTFARLVPSDAVQADALLASMAGDGVDRLAVLTDDDAPGAALAEAVRVAARRHGIAPVLVEQADSHATVHPDLVAAVLAKKPDVVLYAGAMRDVAVRVWRELADADPSLILFAPNALADPAFARRVGALATATYATQPLLPLADYPPAARSFARSFTAAYGDVPSPEALYGYEAMRTAIAAIRHAVRAAGDGAITRSDVVRAFFDSPRHDGVLGPFRIDRNGDSSLRRLGLYRLLDGRLRFQRVTDG